MNEREKELLTKAADTLYWMSVRAKNPMTAKRFERLSESIEAILYDYAEEDENE